jgi:hypothetical protein
LPGELVVLRDWTRELYIRRADLRKKTAESLAAEVGEEPEEEGKSGAEDEACDDREVESRVFTAVDDVAWEFAEAKREFAAEIEESADEDEEAAEDQESAAEFAERIHLMGV